MFRNRARGGPTLVFRPIERRSQTFFWLSPISNVKFGLLGWGGHGPMAPPSTRPDQSAFTYLLRLPSGMHILEVLWRTHVLTCTTKQCSVEHKWGNCWNSWCVDSILNCLIIYRKKSIRPVLYLKIFSRSNSEIKIKRKLIVTLCFYNSLDHDALKTTPVLKSSLCQMDTYRGQMDRYI